MSIPAPGRIVLYTLNKQDADATNKRRIDTLGTDGNSVAEGDVYPMMIVRVWGSTSPSQPVNGQVFLDGNDTLWVTSTNLGTDPRTFAWPERSVPPRRIS